MTTITIVSISRPQSGVEYLGPPFLNWNDGMTLALDCIKGKGFREYPTGNGAETPGDRSRQWKAGSNYVTVEEVKVSEGPADAETFRWLIP